MLEDGLILLWRDETLDVETGLVRLGFTKDTPCNTASAFRSAATQILLYDGNLLYLVHARNSALYLSWSCVAGAWLRQWQ